MSYCIPKTGSTIEPMQRVKTTKLSYSFNTQTHKMSKEQRPELVWIDKETKECQIIDVAITGDERVCRKEEEKMLKYKESEFELVRLWCVRSEVIASHCLS